MTPDIRLDHPFRRRGLAPHQGDILPSQGAFAAVIGKLQGKPLMGGIRFRHDHDPARVLVQPVYDPRTFDTADTRQAFATMRNQCVYEGSGPVAGSGMDDEPRGDYTTGQGGNGVEVYPAVLNGWVQTMPDAWKARMTCEQREPLRQALC